MKVWERAHGRWPEILTALGHADALNQKHGPCPSCGGKDRYRFVGDDDGRFFCGSVNTGSGMQLLQHLRNINFKEAANLVEEIIGKEENREPVDDATRRAKLALDNVTNNMIVAPRSAYLEGRGITTMPPGLRWMKELAYYNEEGKLQGRLPAMVGPIRNKRGELLSHHLTYLDKGKKANVSTPRKIMTGQRIKGGSIQLYPAAEIMGVAEGIETAISASELFGVPVWSAINTSGMATWEPPEIAKEVYIFADNDENFAGHAAAYTLAHRLALMGIKVYVTLPVDIDGMPDFGDWNDVLVARNKAKAAGQAA